MSGEAAAEAPIPCPQKSCASVEGLKITLGIIQDNVVDMRAHLARYENQFSSHMDNEEKLTARNAKALEELTTVVGKIQSQDQLEKVRKDAASKTAKRIILYISIALTPICTFLAFMWGATGASIVFGG